MTSDAQNAQVAAGALQVAADYPQAETVARDARDVQVQAGRTGDTAPAAQAAPASQPAAQAAPARTIVEVRDVHFAYRTGPEILKGVSLSVDAGHIVCLLGSNGTGKTTLLRALLGFTQPRSGEVLVEGRSLSQMKPRERAHCMAYVPQSSALAFPYLAKEVVLMGRVSHLAGGAAHSRHDWDVVAESMERLQIGHLAERRYQELSGGEKQMVLVARALAQQAELLVMDEPTANLDYHNQVKILTAIKYLAEQGLAILMTSHYPDHAFLACSKVALMKGGHVVAWGDPDDVVTSESLTDLYDTPVSVTRAEVAPGVFVKTCIPLLDASLFERG